MVAMRVWAMVSKTLMAVNQGGKSGWAKGRQTFKHCQTTHSILNSRDGEDSLRYENENRDREDSREACLK